MLPSERTKFKIQSVASIESESPLHITAKYCKPNHCDARILYTQQMRAFYIGGKPTVARSFTQVKNRREQLDGHCVNLS